MSMLKPLAEALDVSVSELLDGERRSPDKMKSIPDDAVILTVEDADKAAMTGIHVYAKKAWIRERIYLAVFAVAMIVLMFTARGTYYEFRVPVDFQNGDLDFSEIRVTMEDGSMRMISLDDPQGTELKAQIRKVLREEMPPAEEIGKLDALPESSGRNGCVQLEKLITIYKGVYYDANSWGYYTFLEINEIYQRIYGLCSAYLAEGA